MAVIARRRLALIAGVALAGTLVSGVAIGAGTGPTVRPPAAGDTYRACMTRDGAVRYGTIRLNRTPPACPNVRDVIVSWSAAGEQGPAGALGPAGPAGARGATGATGPRGSSILTGSGAPGAATGIDGDLYLDTGATVLYGPKVAGAWPGSGVSLVGPEGPPGPEGPQGPAGADGTATTTTTTTQPAPVLYDLWLLNGGGNKLAVVTVVKDLTGLGLKEAKDLVDLAPQLVLADLDRVTAEAFKKAIVDQGGEAELR